jgi:hypothetical protein
LIFEFTYWQNGKKNIYVLEGGVLKIILKIEIEPVRYLDLG